MLKFHIYNQVNSAKLAKLFLNRSLQKMIIELKKIIDSEGNMYASPAPMG